MSDLRRHRHVVKSLMGWILFVVTSEADLLVRYDQTHGSEFNRSGKQAHHGLFGLILATRTVTHLAAYVALGIIFLHGPGIGWIRGKLCR